MTQTEEIKKELDICDEKIKAAIYDGELVAIQKWRSIEYGIRIACRILGVDLADDV